jgi:hypothetical protein
MSSVLQDESHSQQRHARKQRTADHRQWFRDHTGHSGDGRGPLLAWFQRKLSVLFDPHVSLLERQRAWISVRLILDQLAVQFGIDEVVQVRKDTDSSDVDTVLEEGGAR